MKTCTRADLLLLLLAVLGNAWLYHWAASGEQGRELLVTAGSGAQQRLDLTDDQVLAVPGPLGETVLEVRGGGVRIRSSPCAHKVCVRAGWARQAGAFIACLPNRVSAQLLGGERSYDGINY